MKALIVKTKRQIASEVGDHVTQSRASARIYIALIIEDFSDPWSFYYLQLHCKTRCTVLSLCAILIIISSFFFLQLQLIF